MKANNWDESVHQENIRQLSTDKLVKAYMDICQLGFNSNEYSFTVRNQGLLLTLQFRLVRDNLRYHLGGIINRNSITFYVRNPYLDYFDVTSTSLIESLSAGVINNSGEIKFAILTARDVEEIILKLLKLETKAAEMTNQPKIDEIAESDEAILETATAISQNYQIDSDDSNAESDEIDDPIHDDINQIRWRDASWTISEVFNRFKRGRIELQPEFQRDYVWTPKIQKKFIESIFLGLPLPKIYLSEIDDSRCLVIDGQQRLTTIINYRDGIFQLTEFSIDGLRGLINKKFSSLPQSYQDKFDDYSLSLTILDRTCSPNLKFDMFERLNQGSVKLNKQELRNCSYRGTYNLMLSDIADGTEFLRACGWSASQKRMKGEEMALRFFTFYNRNIDTIRTYDGALNDELRNNQNMNEKFILERKQLFRDALSMCTQVFGPNPFRLWGNGRNDVNPNGNWVASLNSVVFEVLMTSLILHPKPIIVKNADGIREEFIDLLSTDQFMVDSLTLGTNSREKMLYRHNTWRNRLRVIVGSTEIEPRLFTLSFKKSLFQTDPTCALCHQAIHGVDDAAVDHIEHYWRGGQTIPENARLTHRYCNSRRGGR